MVIHALSNFMQAEVLCGIGIPAFVNSDLTPGSRGACGRFAALAKIVIILRITQACVRRS